MTASKFTTEELAALRLPLAGLVDLNVFGMSVQVDGWDDQIAKWVSVETDRCSVFMQPAIEGLEKVTITTAATQVADALARWCAEWVGLDPSCGVIWHPGYSHDGEFGWILYVTDGNDSAEYWFSAEDEDSPLYAINPDPDDDRELPDGSRYVDRLALRTIAVWLAQRPKAERPKVNP